MKIQTIKSGSVVFLIHALSVVNILLCKNDLITDVAWFAFQIILCIIAIPIYFFVKNDTTNKWIYTLTSLIAHSFFSLLVYFVLGNVFNGWDIAIIYLTEIFLSVTFGIVLLIDIIVNVKS